MKRESHFLKFRPSQIAASALLLSINISKSNLAPTCGVKQIGEEDLRLLFLDEDINQEIGPLQLWTDSIEKTTFLRREVDIDICYR